MPNSPGVNDWQDVSSAAPSPASSATNDWTDVPSNTAVSAQDSGATGVSGVFSGIGAGVFKTAQGAENLVNKALPSSMQIPAIPSALTEERTPSEKLGGGLETIGEFITGDEALKGLDLAARLGLATKVAKIAQQSPRIARAIEIGMNALRAGTVGGAQGATGAAAEGQSPVKGAEAGAAGGALGSAAGEAIIAPGIARAGKALENVAPKFGNALLQANKVKNFQYGKNPGRVFIDEDIPANPPWQDYADVQKSIKKAGSAISSEAHGIISQSPNANVTIRITPGIHQIFDDALDEVSNRAGLTDRQGLISDLEKLRDEMTENFDRKGNSTGQKGPMTPAEITKLKTNIGRGTSWDPTKSAEAQKFLNNVRKQVYSYLDSEVDNAVPEMKDLNARWANQIEAEQMIAPRVAQEQAAAYGHSKAVSRSVLLAGAGLIGHGLEQGDIGQAIAGGGLILNEAARTPAARIALAKGATATGKAAPAVGRKAAQLVAAGGVKIGEEANSSESNP